MIFLLLQMLFLVDIHILNSVYHVYQPVHSRNFNKQMCSLGGFESAPPFVGETTI